MQRTGCTTSHVKRESKRFQHVDAYIQLLSPRRGFQFKLLAEKFDFRTARSRLRPFALPRIHIRTVLFVVELKTAGSVS